MTAPELKFRQSTDVVWRRSLDGVLLLLRRGRAPITLSGSGLDLWQLLEEPQSLNTAAGLLAERFDLDAGEVAAAIGPVLDELVKIQIVESIST